jgi:RNA polymerase sigma-70 factor (sigma-E family)
MPESHGQSFGEFVTEALPALLRFGHVLTGNPDEAEDLVQEALAKSMRCWRRAGPGDPRSACPGDPIAYVRRVMVNTHVSRWRRWGSRVLLGEVPESAAEDSGLQRSHDRDVLRRALASLPARQRAVLVLRYLEDLPDDEIAATLGCQQATVRSLASRGLASLRAAEAGYQIFTGTRQPTLTAVRTETAVTAEPAEVTRGF